MPRSYPRCPQECVQPLLYRLCVVLLCAFIGIGQAWAGSLLLLNAGGSGAVAPAYTGPGDINGAAYAWYGLRAFSAAYATSNGNIADIVDTATGSFSCTMKATANGNADLTSLSCTGGTLSVTTFCTVTHAAGCSVTKLYDQSGNARHVSNATLANMPALALSGLGGLPALTFTQNTDNLQSAAAASITPPFTSSVVAKATTNGSIWYDDNDGNTIFVVSSNWGLNTTGGSLNCAASSGSFHSFQGLTNGTTSSCYVDGSLTSGSMTNSFTFNGKINIGSQSLTGSNGIAGSIAEVGFWASDKTANNSSMNSNQHTYWGF